MLTFLRNGGAHVKIGGFVLDVLSQSDDVLQLWMSLLQITFSHLQTDAFKNHQSLAAQMLSGRALNNNSV